MKTCPVCSETYSERIDFCFSDGSVLTLLPSALDAPVPRMITVTARGTGERLRTGRTEEVTADPREPVPVPARADEPPEAAQLPREDETVVTVEAQVEAKVEATAVEQALPPEPTGVLAGDDLVGGTDDREQTPWGFWFLGAAFVVIAAVVVVFVVGGSGSRGPAPSGEPPSVAAAAAPVPKRPVASTAAAASEVIRPQPAESPPAPPEPLSSDESATPTSPTASTPERPEERAPPPPEPKPRPTVTVRDTPIRPPPEPTSAPENPWGMAAVREGLVRFESVPAGAVVRVDGVFRGKTPLDVKLPFGRFGVELQLDGHQPVSRSVDVRSAELRVPSVLEPIVREGSVLIVVPPAWEGAALLIDGRPRGRLTAEAGRQPALELRLSEGLHAFEVRLGDASGSERREVSLTDRGLTRLSLDPR